MTGAKWVTGVIVVALLSVLAHAAGRGAGSGAQEPRVPSDAAPLPVPGRSMVVTRDGIVATSQPLAARAGVAILEHGGNAIDAAIATNAAMGLMEPTGNGIGG